MNAQVMSALARADEVRRAAAARRREIAALPMHEGADALAAAIVSGELGAVPVERAILSVHKLGPRKVRKLMRAAEIVGNPRLREVSPRRLAVLVLLLRRREW